jgi:Flp pilus assembly pilin Flp
MEESVMLNLIRNLVRDARGEDLIEYGLLAAFVGGIALAVLPNPALKSALSDALNKAMSALTHV